MSYQHLLKRTENLSRYLFEYFSKRSNFNHQVVKIITLSIATLVITQKLYLTYFGALRKLPGPFYTRFMDIPRILLETPKGTSFQKLKYLHERYGDIVRLGPTTVSVADKDLVRQVLLTDDLPKGPIYKAFQRNGESTLFSATDKHWHKNRRRIVSPAFSIKYLNSLEPFMQNCTQLFIKQIDNEIELTKDNNGYGTVDIWGLLQRLALDVIGETAFGDSFEMIANNNHPIPHAISQAIRIGAIRALLPLFSKILLINTEDPEPTIKSFLENIINERLKDKTKERSDILQYLINSQRSQDKNDRLTSKAIIEETVLFLIAGSETTSNTTGFVFYELLRNPDKLAKLYEEIDTVVPREDGLFHHEQIKHLAYLNAVINETLRLDPVSAATLNRTTTSPMILGNLVLPENTNVLVNTYHLQTNEKYWRKPHEFIPERWTDASNKNDLDASVPFSLGSRNCIGKNFALQEMRLSIATILKHFDIQPIESEMESGKIRRQFVTQRIAANSFRIKIKRRN